ncbi:MAG TPA: DUF1800 family protein [Saprospiraceae bacterium]|nr:DUF1800 family protein [Saprospiraceae bacterium]
MPSLSPLSGVLGHRKAAHLLRRTTYRYTRTRVDELAALSAADALASLLTAHPLQLEQPLYGPASTPKSWINPPAPSGTPPPAEESELRPYVMGWWVHEALHDPGISHKMMLFLHQYLAVDAESGSSAQFFDYLSLLRWASLGNTKKLLVKVVTDNCMLTYLDNDQNFKGNPNENFAREFFELFTIGTGPAAGPGDYTTYTEEDIVQTARVLTGFNHALRNQHSDPETGIPTGKAYPQSHDFGPKTFSPRLSNTVIEPPTQDAAGMQKELEALVDMVFAQEETARNICRRLYRFLVTRKISPEVEADIIGGLATTLRDQDFELKPVLAQLLQSEHFFDADDTAPADEIVGALIKSPLDLSLQALAFFQVPIPDPLSENSKHYLEFYNSTVIERMLGTAGMTLFYPFDVAGYSGYYQQPDFNRQFFNSATIIPRYKLPQVLLSGTHAWTGASTLPIGTRLDIVDWVKNKSGITDASDSFVLVKEMLQYLAPEEVSTARFDYFHLSIFLDNLPPNDWAYEWEHFLNTGDDSEVRIPLERLVNAIMYAPEYQVA